MTEIFGRFDFDVISYWIKPGERVHLTEAPFAGIEGIYQMADGERRVMVLIELLSKQVRVRVSPANLRKVG